MRASSIVKWIAGATALNCALLLGLTQCTNVEPPPKAEQRSNQYGSYLAGRFAASERDADAAAQYFGAALKFDPANPELLERVILSDIARGDVDSAADNAEALIKTNTKARLPHLVIAVRALRDKGYAKAQAHFEKVAGNPAAEIGSKLGLGYALYAEGRLQEAKAAISKLVNLGGTRAFALYHQAVIEDLSGKDHDAERDFEEANRLSNGESLRILQAYAGYLARKGRMEDAQKVYREFLKRSPHHSVITKALERIEAGQAPARIISSASEGMAETFYGIASSLTEDDAVEIPVFYLQLALSLEPNHDLSLSLLGDRMEEAQRYEDAISAYSRIAETSPLFRNARQQIAQNLQRLEKHEEALDLLRKSLTNSNDDAEIHASIGDTLRAKEDYAGAIDAYTKALSTTAKSDEYLWTLYYTRGISYERTKRWREAETDLKRALKIKPDQAMVMNYLAYSWVEQGINTSQALAMLKRAVELRPEDGFIVDSLGWAHYRLGDYKTAVENLEKAILLEPGQATINDHLGDAYWQVGRKLEAKFQWRRALTLGPEEGEAPKIQQKLEVGLPEPPKAPTHAGTPASAGQ